MFLTKPAAMQEVSSLNINDADAVVVCVVSSETKSQSNVIEKKKKESESC